MSYLNLWFAFNILDFSCVCAQNYFLMVFKLETSNSVIIIHNNKCLTYLVYVARIFTESQQESTSISLFLTIYIYTSGLSARNRLFYT